MSMREPKPSRCHRCDIAIAPYEERNTLKDKDYHSKCYRKEMAEKPAPQTHRLAKSLQVAAR